MLSNSEYNMKNDNQIKKNWCFSFVIRCVYFFVLISFLKKMHVQLYSLFTGYFYTWRRNWPTKSLLQLISTGQKD